MRLKHITRIGTNGHDSLWRILTIALSVFKHENSGAHTPLFSCLNGSVSYLERRYRKILEFDIRVIAADTHLARISDGSSADRPVVDRARNKLSIPK